MPTTTTLAARNKAIPAFLRSLKRWCEWAPAVSPSGKPTKAPIGSTLDPRNRRSFEEVENVERIGFVLTGGVRVAEGWVYAFDLDGCRDPLTGYLAEWAREVVNAHGRSYTEVTPSGTGLRVWIVSKTQHKFARSRVRVLADAPDNVPSTKNVELQVFGAGAASYVTVTGDKLREALDAVNVVDNLNWLVERFGLGKDEEGGNEKLPRGDGEPPSLDEIERVIRRSPQGEAMIAGRWEEVLGDAKGSASEVFARLTQTLLRAARGHGAVVVDFILQRTAWGRGEIENSLDPARYARREWVERDVARSARKLPPPPPPSEVFDELPVNPTPLPKTTELRTESEEELYARFRTQEFLVNGVLPRVGIAQFFGDPSAGKTPFLVSLAIHVAGEFSTWFGQDIDRHGPVLYLVGEDSNGVSMRFQAERQRLGVTKPLPIRFSKMPGKLTDPADVAAWIKEMRTLFPEGCALVVVDTQSDNFGEGDENSTSDMAKFRDNIKALSRLLGCLVASVHHTGHKDKDRARGSSVLFGSLDACFEVSRLESAVQAVAVKHKNWSQPEPLAGELVVHTFQDRADAKGRPVTAITLSDEVKDAAEVFETEKNADPLARLLALVQARAGRPLTLDEIARRLELPLRGRKVRSLVERAEKDLHLIESTREFEGRLVGYLQGRVYSLTPKGLAALAAAPKNQGETPEEGAPWE